MPSVNWATGGGSAFQEDARYKIMAWFLLPYSGRQLPKDIFTTKPYIRKIFVIHIAKL